MSGSTFKTKVGDTGRRIRFRVRGPDGTPLDLTGRTVKLYSSLDGVAKLAGVVCTNEDQTAAETRGYAYYDPLAGDVDTEATYDAEVKVFDGADPVSIPVQNFLQIVVSRSLA
jgi:hypothetical protein